MAGRLIWFAEASSLTEQMLGGSGRRIWNCCTLISNLALAMARTVAPDSGSRLRGSSPRSARSLMRGFVAVRCGDNHDEPLWLSTRTVKLINYYKLKRARGSKAGFRSASCPACGIWLQHRTGARVNPSQASLRASAPRMSGNLRYEIRARPANLETCATRCAWRRP